jgi:hypothetical protein
VLPLTVARPGSVPDVVAPFIVGGAEARRRDKSLDATQRMVAPVGCGTSSQTHGLREMRPPPAHEVRSDTSGECCGGHHAAALGLSGAHNYTVVLHCHAELAHVR